ncbi:MAG: hypothetical protein ACYSR9_02025 [Planctomycetota bacterium]|jgi:hypothetical protein
MNDSPKAQRFTAYWENSPDGPRFIWDRNEWDNIDELLKKPDQFVPVDVTSTPMNKVEIKACVTACIAGKSDDCDGIIEVWRNDPKDVPKPYNQDKYKVWRGETLLKQSNLKDKVNACLTAVDSNFVSFARQHVFLIKEPPGKEHHSEALPERVWMAYSENRNK